MALKFEIVEGNLKITNTQNNSVVVLFSKQNIAPIANIILDTTSPVVLYNIPKGYNETIFRDILSNCVDGTNTPFTPETFLEFCELNLGFNSPGATGTITVEDSYLTLPPANTKTGKFYWCQNSEGIYLTGLYYSNGTTWETSEATQIKVEANYSALPDPTTVPGQYYWCENSQGLKWLPGSLGGTYYSKGMYYSNGTSWSFLDVPYQATQAEVNAGLNDDKFVTANTLSNSNWAFTTAKVLDTLLTGVSFTTGGSIVSTDSILIAFGKIQKQINDLITALGLKSDKPQTLRVSTNIPLLATTASQKLFGNLGTNGDGSLTLEVGRYKMDMIITLTNLANSGSIGFITGLGDGTSVFSNIAMAVTAFKGSFSGTGAGSFTRMTSFTSNTAISGTGTNTNGFAQISGEFSVTTAGKFYPGISLNVSATPDNNTGSFCTVTKID